MRTEFQEILQAISELSARQAAHVEETHRQSEKIDELTQRSDRVEQAINRNETAIDRLKVLVAKNAEATQDNRKAILGNTEEIRQAHVLIEGNRSAIELVAEGVLAANQRSDSLRAEMHERFDAQESLLSSTLGHLATSHGGRLDRLESLLGLN